MLSNRAVNEVRASWAGYIFTNVNPVSWSHHWMAQGGPYGPVTTGSPRIQFTGFNITGNNGYPRHRSQDLYSVQDSFTLSYDENGDWLIPDDGFNGVQSKANTLRVQQACRRELGALQ